jgi:hypothetical protein
LITGGDGDWYIEDPIPGSTPEEAIETYEKESGDGLAVGNKYAAYEVVGDAVDFTTLPALKRTK